MNVTINDIVVVRGDVVYAVTFAIVLDRAIVFGLSEKTTLCWALRVTGAE